jgi:hypothetical protein
MMWAEKDANSGSTAALPGFKDAPFLVRVLVLIGLLGWCASPDSLAQAGSGC